MQAQNQRGDSPHPIRPLQSSWPVKVLDQELEYSHDLYLSILLCVLGEPITVKTDMFILDIGYISEANMVSRCEHYIKYGS